MPDHSNKSKSANREGQGISRDPAKLNSKNFDRLMSDRGLSKSDRESLKSSFDRKAGMQTRHAKAGEQYVTTHGQDGCSGVFVSDKSLGNSASERVNKGALPHSNTADYETKVELARDQNVVTGQIAPQSKFQKMDPKGQPRSGGGTQVVTDGGYKKGAVQTRDAKYPAVAKNDFQKKAAEHRAQNGMTSGQQQASRSNGHSQSKGQSR